MRPAGLAEVEAAKADGRWADAYPPHSRAEPPPDLQAALDANPKAAAFFATLKGANRYAPHLPDPRREEAGDAGEADRRFRGDAGARRNDPRLDGIAFGRGAARWKLKTTTPRA